MCGTCRAVRWSYRAAAAPVVAPHVLGKLLRGNLDDRRLAAAGRWAANGYVAALREKRAARGSGLLIVVLVADRYAVAAKPAQRADVAPTVVALLGREVPAGMVGRRAVV